MRLSSHTDFGLRMLMALAATPECLMTIEELARRYRLSQNHMMKVAQSLICAGFVTGVRGRGGGLRLARDAREIRVGDVVRALEEDLALVACLGDTPTSCILSGPCRLTSALAAFFAELNMISLADLAAIRDRLGLPTEGRPSDLQDA